MDIEVTITDQTVSFYMNGTSWSLYFKKRFDLAIRTIFTPKQLSGWDFTTDSDQSLTIWVDSKQLEELIQD